MLQPDAGTMPACRWPCLPASMSSRSFAAAQASALHSSLPPPAYQPVACPAHQLTPSHGCPQAPCSLARQTVSSDRGPDSTAPACRRQRWPDPAARPLLAAMTMACHLPCSSSATGGGRQPALPLLVHRQSPAGCGRRELGRAALGRHAPSHSPSPSAGTMPACRWPYLTASMSSRSSAEARAPGHSVGLARRLPPH